MQREEKQLDAALEAIIMRVNDLKNSIGSMLVKLEHEYETLNWPTFLDNFALMSGHTLRNIKILQINVELFTQSLYIHMQTHILIDNLEALVSCCTKKNSRWRVKLTALSKMLSHDKSPPLRSLTVLPLRLSPERDEELMRLTESRVSTFAHDLVPDYLRTKPEPEVEHKMLQMEHKAANQSYETAQKQVAAYTKVVNHVWDIVSKSREEWETESGSRSGTNQTSSVSDTHALVAAVGMGKGLKVMVAQPVQSGPQSMMVAPVGRPGGGGPQQPGAPMNPNQSGPMGPMVKAPSTIKTNIKAATQIHPYAR